MDELFFVVVFWFWGVVLWLVSDCLVLFWLWCGLPWCLVVCYVVLIVFFLLLGCLYCVFFFGVFVGLRVVYVCFCWVLFGKSLGGLFREFEVL